MWSRKQARLVVREVPCLTKGSSHLVFIVLIYVLGGWRIIFGINFKWNSGYMLDDASLLLLAFISFIVLAVNQVHLCQLMFQYIVCIKNWTLQPRHSMIFENKKQKQKQNKTKTKNNNLQSGLNKITVTTIRKRGKGNLVNIVYHFLYCFLSVDIPSHGAWTTRY